MTKYLGFVVVYNLLQADYTDERTKEIKKAINIAISSATGGRFQATDENVLFHFSEDRSVRSSEIPVALNIQFLVPLYIGLEEQNEMADLIRATLLQTAFCGRGDVLAIVLSIGLTGLITAFSPRR